jgi:hypothetical protein
MDHALTPMLESDGDRVVRLRLKAEEYRAVADHTQSPSSRAAFLRFADTADQMAAEAQGRITAHAKLTSPKPSDV